MNDKVENWLVNMSIGEISLVPEPSNAASDVVFIKSAKGGGGFKPCDDCKTVAACGKGDVCAAAGPAAKSFAKLAAVLKEADARKRGAAQIADIFAKLGALRDAVSATTNSEGLTAVHKSNTIRSDFDEFEALLGELAPQAVISKAVAETMASISKGDDPDAIVGELIMDHTALAAALQTAESTIETLTADLAKATGRVVALEKAAKAGAADADDALIFEGLSEVAITKIKGMREEAALNKAAFAKMAEDKGISDTIVILKAKFVPDADKVAPALYRVSIGKALGARKETVDGKEVEFASDSDIIKQALFAKAAASKAPLRAVGADTDFRKEGETGEGEGAGVEIRKIATEIAKEKSISVDAAMGEALNRNPDLYRRYTAEMKQRSAAG